MYRSYVLVCRMASSLPGSALALVSTILLVSRVAYTKARQAWACKVTVSDPEIKISWVYTSCRPHLCPTGRSPRTLKRQRIVKMSGVRCTPTSSLTARHAWDGLPSMSTASPSSSSSSSSSAAPNAAHVAFIFLSLEERIHTSNVMLRQVSGGKSRKWPKGLFINSSCEIKKWFDRFSTDEEYG